MLHNNQSHKTQTCEKHTLNQALSNFSFLSRFRSPDSFSNNPVRIPKGAVPKFCGGSSVKLIVACEAVGSGEPGAEVGAGVACIVIERGLWR